MSALELITVQATAPGTGAAFSAAAGNSLTIRDSRAPIWMVKAWQTRQSPGFTRYTSPLLHDAVVGIGGQGILGTVETFEGWQRLFPQDTLTATGSGSAVGGDIEFGCFLVFYEDLPGSSQRLITFDEVWKRGEEVYSFPNTLANGTAGGYSGSELVTAEADQFKANRDYAWIGTSVGVAGAAVRLTGTDFGNLGVGQPAGTLSRPGTFFQDMARRLAAALVPVINSSNKSNTFIDGVQDENGADIAVVSSFVLLAPTGRRK